MAGSNDVARRSSSPIRFLAHHPIRSVLILLPPGIAAMLAIDAALGSRAEFYNAVHLLQAWRSVLTGGSVADAPTFLVGQEELGEPAAMAIGTGLLVMEPAVLLAILVLPASAIARWLVRRRENRP